MARADFSRFAKLQLDPGRAQVTLVVRPFDVDDAGAELPLTGAVVRWTPDMPPPIWITEAMVEIYGMQPGRVVELPLAGRLQPFMPVGVWRDYARQFGAIAMRTEDYQAATGDNTITDAALWLKPGWTPTRVAEELRAEMDAGAATEFVQPGDIRKLSLQIFDRSFAVTYVLEIAAIAIGLIGIAATFSSQAIARTREFGMLRHIGLTRGQILGLLAIEGALVTALAIVVGLVDRARGLAGADQGDQPPVVPLDDGLQRSRAADRGTDGCADGCRRRDRGDRRPARGVDRRRARGAGRLVTACRAVAHFLLSSLALAAPVRAAVDYAVVTPRRLVFPRDHGAHPDYRTEWWYLTGWLDGPAGAVARLPGDVLPDADRGRSRQSERLCREAADHRPRRACRPGARQRCCTTNASRAPVSAGPAASEVDTAVRLGAWTLRAAGERRVPLRAARARLHARVHGTTHAAAAAAGRRRRLAQGAARPHRRATTTRSRNSRCGRN